MWEEAWGQGPGSEPALPSLPGGSDPGPRPLLPVPRSPIPWPCRPRTLSLAGPAPPHRYLVPEGGPGQSLADKPLRAFVREVGARSAAPGGGSVAAACAAMVSARAARPRTARGRLAWGPESHARLLSAQGAALASMAGLMTYGRRQFEHLDATMRRLIPPLHAAAAELTALVDVDARAFQAYLVGAQRDPASPRGSGGDGVSGRRGRPPGSWSAGGRAGAGAGTGRGEQGRLHGVERGRLLSPLPPLHAPAWARAVLQGSGRWGGGERRRPVLSCL